MALIKRVADQTARRLVASMDRPWVRPRQVIVDITDYCTFRCTTCDKWRAEPQNEFDVEQWQRIWTELHAWLGPFHLSISGGEPLLREDLPEIIAHASGLGCTVSMMSNGWALDGPMAESLVAAGLSNLTLSLNGMRPETHDATRGVQGSHTRVVEAVTQFNQARRGRTLPVSLSLNVIVADFNATELPDLVRWARGAGVDAVGLQPLMNPGHYQPYSSVQAEKLDVLDSGLWPAKAFNPLEFGTMLVSQALDELIKLKQASYPILNSVTQLRAMQRYFAQDGQVPAGCCMAGINNYLIDPHGEVRLCYRQPPIGELCCSSPREIWLNERAAAARRAIRRCQRECRLLNCNL